MGGGGGGFENFHMETFFYMRLLLQTIFFCVSVFLQTLSLFFTCIHFVSVFKIFQPPPAPAKKLVARPLLTWEYAGSYSRVFTVLSKCHQRKIRSY